MALEPILLDSTGKDIKTAIQNIADVLANTDLIAEQKAELQAKFNELQAKINGNITNIDKIGEILDGLNRIKDTLGAYADIDPITLTNIQTGKAVNATGVVGNKTGWAMGEFTAEKGNEYLFAPAAIDGNVAIFAEKITRTEIRTIDYTHTYNEDGTQAESTATYKGVTYRYEYIYTTTGEQGQQTTQLTEIREYRSDKSASAYTVVNALPVNYTAQAGSYQPLTVLNANAQLPADGYCRFLSHFKGNTAINVVVSYKVTGSTAPQLKVLRDGIFDNLSTQLGNLSTKIDTIAAELENTQSELAVLQREVEELRKHVAYADDSKLPTLCGQPSILFGHGTPQEAIVPDNWVGFKNGGYEWTGKPSALGQQYINLDASANGRYIAVPDASYLELKWLNC